MFNNGLKQIRIAMTLLLIFMIVTGFLYPLLMTGIAQLIFPWQANGSLMISNGKIVGSMWLGQNFTEAKYFWGRPSATLPFPYNAANSSGSNLGPSNPILLDQIKQRINTLQQSDPQNKHPIPINLVTSSGSGLDPDITPEAALYQISRVAAVRHLTEPEVNHLISLIIKNRQLGILGEPRVNVLQLNLLLNNLAKPP